MGWDDGDVVPNAHSSQQSAQTLHAFIAEGSTVMTDG